jgi:protein SCO1
VTGGFAPLLGVIVLAGIAALSAETDGFRVVTSEGARRLAIERAPAALPRVVLTDQDGAPFALEDYRGKVVLIDFIYTSCPALCSVLGDDFRRMAEIARRRADGREVALVSISFDRAHDGPPALKLYAERFGAAAPRWRIAVPASAAGLDTLLHSFGVVVLSDGAGGFVHDGAVYVVDPRGRLARILDPGTPAGLIEEALRSALG